MRFLNFLGGLFSSIFCVIMVVGVFFTPKNLTTTYDQFPFGELFWTMANFGGAGLYGLAAYWLFKNQNPEDSKIWPWGVFLGLTMMIGLWGAVFFAK